MQAPRRLLGGILLVSGITIGAGMLALPVITGFAGFFPTLLLFCGYWFYMTYTALLMLEVNLSMKDNINLISMVKQTLGKTGELFSWFIYLFLLYTLTTAYIAGSGPIVIDMIFAFTGITFPIWSGSIPLLLIFGFFVYRGTQSVDYVNRLLMVGLSIAYIIMVIFLTPHVNPHLLSHVNWKYLFLAVSVVATSFGFHIIIPTLTTYMHRDVMQIKKAILIGSFIPLVIYSIWELITLGIIPLYGKFGIVEGYAQGTNGAHLLSAMLGNTSLAMIARFFSFFAIVTSFLGVSLSLSHFLEDGFKIKPTRTGKMIVYGLTFLPPLIFTLTDPRAFLTALEYAGAFGVVILLGLFPALMVWRGRYVIHYQSTYTAPGGKLCLLAVMLLSILVMGIELSNKAGWLSFINDLNMGERK